MVDAAAQREEPFVAVCDVRFNLLGRHSRVERGDNNDRNIDLRKQIDRHARNCRDSDHNHKQAHHQNEEGIFDREGGHY